MSKPTHDLQWIFGQALERNAPADRARYLAETCGDDAELRDEVESLLRVNDAAGSFLETPACSMPTLDESTLGEGPGSTIGPYKLLRPIGEGGMGVVYLAEQVHPIHRLVALKIIKPGRDSRRVIARFEAERQAVALMDHPNIARVLDAGATATGRPYFVMELVQGIPITVYCDQARLTPRQRLELFVPVCQATQHAHQKGIIHRDVKPSNVLVALIDGQPVPKIIDFGVAKAIEQPLIEQTLSTQDGTIIGTLEYMSPEQADLGALDIDTRTDVYSLGVLLYELLTGTTPLECHSHEPVGHAALIHRIREEEPPRPSLRLAKTERIAEIAARRRMEPDKLVRLVRGELDWIVMKALEKDRNRRYATANGLARDVQRYLAGEPVEAGPPSAGYRLRKYAQKHRVALAMAGAFAAVLVAATAISSWQAIRATREEARARRSEVEAKAVLEFFRDRVLAATRPEGQDGGLGRTVTLRAVLDAAEPGIVTGFPGEPTVEAAIRDTLGVSYFYLGEPSLAIRQHERAMVLRTAALGPDHPDTVTSMNNLAVAYQAAGRAADAIPLHERDLAISRAKLGPDHPDTLKSLSNLATAYRLVGRTAEALPLFESVRAVRRASLGPQHSETLIAMNNLAVAYQAAGRPDEARPLFELVLKHSRTNHGPDHPDTLTAMSNLAAVSIDTGRPDDALPLLEETLKLRRIKLGPDHPDTLMTMNNLGAARLRAGRTAEAIPLFEEALQLRKTRLGPDHPDTLQSMNNLAMARRDAGRTAEALTLFEEVLDLRRAKLGLNHPDTLASTDHLAAAYLETRRWADAAALLRECLKRREDAQPDDWRRFHTMSQLGAALAGGQKPAEAEAYLIRGYEGLLKRAARIPPSRQKDLAAAAARIVPFYEAWGKPEQAARWRQRLAPGR
jgi:serine/threonine protein kinase